MEELFLGADPWQSPKKKKKKKEPPPPPPKPEPLKGPYKVLITPDAEKAFDEMPGDIRGGMEELAERLKAWPEVSGVRALFGKGYAPNKFRVKHRNWRMEFLVDKDTREITVIRIGPRSTFYDEYHE